MQYIHIITLSVACVSVHELVKYNACVHASARMHVASYVHINVC